MARKRLKRGDKNYVNNKEFLAEMIKSREQDELTYEAYLMMRAIAERLILKFTYPCEEDKEDCISGAVMDCVLFWRKFDPERSQNPFAYFTQVCKNGFAKTWSQLGYKDCPVSARIRLDCTPSIQL